MTILLVSYFFSPSRTVAAERWERFSRYLEKKGHSLLALSGPWNGGERRKKLSGGIDVLYLGDPLSRDASEYKKGDDAHAPRPQRANAIAQLVRRAVRVPPAFLLIDGKWFWSLKIFLGILWKRGWARGRDLVVVSGTPWSSVVAVAAACFLARRKYVVDFRDLWASEPELRFRSPRARRYFLFLERFVLRHASAVLTVNDALKAYFERESRTVPFSIPNGFDGDLAFTAEAFNSIAGKEKKLFYAGSIALYHGVDRFFAAYDAAGVSLPLAFMGVDHLGVLKEKNVETRSSRPKDEALREMGRAGVLLMTLAPHCGDYTTGKIMAYLKAGRPILFWGPSRSPAAEIVRRHGLGWVADCADADALRRALTEIREHFALDRPFGFKPDIQGLRCFSIEALGPLLESCLRLEGHR